MKCVRSHFLKIVQESMSYTLLGVIFSVSLVSITLSSESLHILSNILLDEYGGKHPTAMLGYDNKLFISYISDTMDTGNGIGIIHCNDMYCDNRTQHYIDTDESNTTRSSQLFMRISSYTKCPQILYSFWTDISKGQFDLRLITCYNYNCTNNTLKIVYFSTNTHDNVYVYFIYDYVTVQIGYPIIVYNADPSGLYLIQCQSIECSSNQINGPYVIDNTSSNLWYVSMTRWQDFMYFIYYDNYHHSLKYSWFNYSNWNHTVHGILMYNVYGAWNVVTYANMESLNQFSLFYVDTVSAEYIYVNCQLTYYFDPDFILCEQSIIDSDTNITNNVELYDYPDITVDSGFNDRYPLISYFYGTNMLKFAQCNNFTCKEPYIQELSSGNYGNGRESSIQWDTKNEVMYIAYLDYDGINGTNNKPKLLVAKPKLNFAA